MTRRGAATGGCPVPDRPLWTIREAAAWLNKPVETLRDWRKHGAGPPCARLGRELRYAPADVEEWFEQQKQEQAGRRPA